MYTQHIDIHTTHMLLTSAAHHATMIFGDVAVARIPAEKDTEIKTAQEKWEENNRDFVHCWERRV